MYIFNKIGDWFSKKKYRAASYYPVLDDLKSRHNYNLSKYKYENNTDEEEKKEISQMQIEHFKAEHEFNLALCKFELEQKKEFFQQKFK
jgi:hypothetical protein